MAVWEARKNWTISQGSWTDGTSLDPYYWLEHSFQYSANINADDELHWIKLSQKLHKTSSYAKCQLIAAGNNGVFALPMEWGSIKVMEWNWSWSQKASPSRPAVAKKGNLKLLPWVIFQDRIWYWVNAEWNYWLVSGSITWAGEYTLYKPCDHLEDTDEAISTKDEHPYWYMLDAITAILNYNNARLVVASWQDIWVYYPELDTETHDIWVRWVTGWKKVMHFEDWITIVKLTCTFEYLKVRAVDEWWNTKIYYYQGNNDLRSTFVYNIVDLTGQRVTNVYPINWIDYYVTSIDGTDWYVSLYKMVWTTPVMLLKQRAWLTQYDINQKAPYFVWPCSIDAWYAFWSFYIADAYWVFKFAYTPNWYDKGYMKWQTSTSSKQVYWLCVNKNILYVSTEDWCYATRVYDTWLDWYEDHWVLISREIEWQYWWTVTKMLDEIRLHYELNPLTTWNGKIEIFVSPNNLWRSTNTSSEWRYKVMEITQVNHKTRTERTELLNCLDAWKPAFEFDWQTITYAVKITVWSEDEATPIVRQIDLNYHTKDKTNYVYDIN